MAQTEKSDPFFDISFEHTDLTRQELEALPPKKLVDIIIWQRHGADMLNDKIKQSETERAKLDNMINQLSIDPNTGILTMGALKVLGDVLIDGGVLQIIKEKGYKLTACMLDVDELRKHNAIGGHAGGDAALAEVAKRLKILFRRKSDVVAYGVVDVVTDAHRSARPEDGGFHVTGRFERGDEMVAWRFTPPHSQDIQRKPQSFSREVTRIKKGFEGAVVSYPALPNLTRKDLKRLDPEGRFKLESGIVTAPITITFACVSAPMPAGRQEARRILRRIDELVMVAKNERKGQAPIESAGTSLALGEDDLI